MKKFALKSTLVAISALFVAVSNTSLAQTFSEGKEYLQVRAAPSAQKEVVEFFSFYCPHCYDYELIYKIPAQVKEGLAKDVAFKQYHVDFLGRQSENLTRAWALAMALGVEDKVKTALFEAAQKDAFSSMDDIRAVFLANGVAAEQFDGGINSFAVNGLVNKQKQAAEEFKVRSTPEFYVNGQYKINSEGQPTDSVDGYIKSYINTILFLANQK